MSTTPIADFVRQLSMEARRCEALKTMTVRTSPPDSDLNVSARCSASE
jgi:hypothetical protein